MDESIVIMANIVAIICLFPLLNRIRYTVPVVGTIVNWNSRRTNSESENEYSIEIEYVVNEAHIKYKKLLTKKSAFRYKEGERISLRIMSNNPYRCIIVHDPYLFTFKFFVVVAAVIDIYTYLELHNILQL